MKKQRTYVILLALWMLSACTVSKDITIPTASVPDFYRNSFADNATDKISAADWEWKRFFPDTGLQALVDKAISGNYDLQNALRNIEMAKLQLSQSKWGQMPKLNGAIGASTSIPSQNSLNGLSLNNFLAANHIENYNLGMSLSWEADIWSKINSSKKEALANYLKTEEVRKTLQTSIVATVVQSYYNLLMLDSQIEIAKKNRTLSERTSHIISRQFEAAQVTNLAVEQAEAQRLEASLIVPKIEKEIIIQENALSILCGALPGNVVRDNKLEGIYLHDRLPTGVPAMLLANRPDVKASEYELHAANARVGITKASMYPSLVVSAEGGINSFLSGNWFNIPSSLFGTLIGGVTQPLLQGKMLKTQYELAKIDREKSVIAFKKQLLVAVGDVSNALTEIEKLKEEIAFAKEKVTRLQRAVGNADKLFSRGMVNYLEVITAQSNLLQSELDVAILKRDQLGAETNLYKALGGGWK